MPENNLEEEKARWKNWKYSIGKHLLHEKQLYKKDLKSSRP